MKVKVISIQQPFASLVVLGLKKFETRYWRTKHEGEFYIHASAGKKYMYLLDDPGFKKFLTPYFIDDPRNLFQFGAIIGKVNLMSAIDTNTIKQMSKSIPLKKDNHFSKQEWEQELAFGNFGPDRYGWLLSNPVAFAKAIPAKGKLSIWEWEVE